MITKTDCILLLTEQQENGVDVSDVLNTLIKQSEPSVEVIKFINDNRQLDLSRFYDKIRKSYNNKKSNLYINIVKEIEDPNEVIITLSAMLTQILLFSKSAENRQMFLKHARSQEISLVLLNYFKNYDITNCIKLLKLIKADLKVIEFINGKTI